MLNGTGISPLSSMSVAVAALILGKAVLIADLLPMIILLVLIAMYCTMQELVRVIGKEKVLRIFFGPIPIPQV